MSRQNRRARPRTAPRTIARNVRQSAVTSIEKAQTDAVDVLDRAQGMRQALEANTTMSPAQRRAALASLEYAERICAAVTGRRINDEAP